MRSIALLYYYRVLNLLKHDNPLSLLSMTLVFGAFCWGIIWYAAAGFSAHVLYVITVCIPVPFLHAAGAIVALSVREQFFVHSSAMRLQWAGRLLALRLFVLILITAGALLFFHSAVSLSLRLPVQQFLLFVIALQAWALFPWFRQVRGKKARSEKPDVHNMQGPAAILLYILLSILFFLLEDLVPRPLLLAAAAVSAGLLTVLFLRMPAPLRCLFEQCRHTGISGQLRGGMRMGRFSRHVSLKHLNLAGINLAGAATGAAAIILIYRYSSQAALLPFVALFLLNAVWALIVLSAAENENYAMPVLSGVRLGHFLILRLQDYLPAISLLAASAAVTGFVWTGWAGLPAAVMPLLMTVICICLYIRHGALSLPRLILYAIAYAGLSAIVYVSLAAGITIIICLVVFLRGQARHYYKERAFDHAEY